MTMAEPWKQSVRLEKLRCHCAFSTGIWPSREVLLAPKSIQTTEEHTQQPQRCYFMLFVAYHFFPHVLSGHCLPDEMHVYTSPRIDDHALTALQYKPSFGIHIAPRVSEPPYLSSRVLLTLSSEISQFFLIRHITSTQALGSSSPLVSREAARALGNLAANLEHGDAILKEGALNIFMALIRSEDHPVQRMAAMALCNLSSNVRTRVSPACTSHAFRK